MKFSEIKAGVQELGDNRVFPEAKHAAWANRIRKGVATDPEIAGFRGIHFLYREATVSGGSVVGQADYALPDDYLSELSVFYAGNLLVKAPEGHLDITGGSSTVPTWLEVRGTGFKLIPPAAAAGDEIKLLYYGLPDDVPAAANDNFEDYFLKRFPDLHIFGMAWLMAGFLGHQLQEQYRGWYDQERRKLAMHNRKHGLNTARIRFQSWDEYEERKSIVFPQFQES